MKSVLVAVGTRPEVIKMAPVVSALRRLVPTVGTQILATGQHREQLRLALDDFQLQADVALDVMRPRQTLDGLASRMLPAVANTLQRLRPDYVLVQGDTLSTFCAAFAAFLAGVPVGHVEAGLRTYDLQDPFPEEADRRLVDVFADLAFAPTPLAAQNLLAERKPQHQVIVTGQTVVDAIRLAAQSGRLPQGLTGRNLVTVTLHRRENWPILPAIAQAIARIAKRFPGHTFYFPVHLNPVVREACGPALRPLHNVILAEPVNYLTMARLLLESDLVITDSGGITEEAVTLGTHVAVARRVLERPEALQLGLASLVGTDPADIELVTSRLLSSGPSLRHHGFRNPYGDGKASERVALAVAWRLGLGTRPSDWSPGVLDG